jgi:hypothetical protein
MAIAPCWGGLVKHLNCAIDDFPKVKQGISGETISDGSVRASSDASDGKTSSHIPLPERAGFVERSEDVGRVAYKKTTNQHIISEGLYAVS